METVRLMIVERRTLFRQGLVSLLHQETEWEVAGEAADVDEAIRLCQRVLPDVILLSGALPEDITESRLASVAALRAYCPSALLCVLGRAGDTVAEGYLGQERDLARRREADLCLSPVMDWREIVHLLRRTLAELRGPEARATTAQPVNRKRVTEREQVILALVAEGLSNKEIAHRTGVGLQTVKNHVSHLLEKLALADRTQLAVYALEHPPRPMATSSTE